MQTNMETVKYCTKCRYTFGNEETRCIACKSILRQIKTEKPLNSFDTLDAALAHYDKILPETGLRVNPPDTVSINDDGFMFDTRAARATEPTGILFQGDYYVAWSDGNDGMVLCPLESIDHSMLEHDDDEDEDDVLVCPLETVDELPERR